MSKVNVSVSVPPSEVESWDGESMRDVSNIGHFGLGPTEISLVSTEQLPALEKLITQSYIRNKKS